MVVAAVVRTALSKQRVSHISAQAVPSRVNETIYGRTVEIHATQRAVLATNTLFRRQSIHSTLASR